MRKLLLAYLLTALHFAFYSQPGQGSFRENDSRNIFIDNNSVYELNVPAGSIVISDSIIQMYPNEKLYLEVDLIGNRFTNFQLVPEVKYPKKTLVLEFKQVVEKDIHKQMILKIQNPFEKELHYNSHIYLLKEKKWVSTNVFPVKAGKTSYEVWPDIITSITLGSLFLKN